ncbi:PhzF family phenazine biosynthesis protein [Brevundimonas vesicularis]|uniref:PhzF family phenazine biosynthesis protein n=1 Tax=Brevundimonas vesicularis TaxID=41276 RepID=UPI0030C5520D
MRQFKVVDAFSARPLMGNPVAVVLDAEGLSDTEMAAIARWTNLSETTFVLEPTSPDADYRVRIFTPGSELPFAGHPTLGTAHAVLEAKRADARDGKIIQECGVGLVEIAIAGDGDRRTLALTLPAATLTPLSISDVTEMEAILGHALSTDVKPAVMDVGAVWAVAQLPSVEALLSLEPDFGRSAAFERRLGLTGLSVFAVDPTSQQVETRSFAPSCGVNEDPVCGSGNGSIAVFRTRNGKLPKSDWTYTAHQGQKVGRAGEINLSSDGAGVIRVGGACVTTVNGTLEA